VVEVVGTSTESWEKGGTDSRGAGIQVACRDLRVAEVVEQDVVIEKGRSRSSAFSQDSVLVPTTSTTL